MVAHSGPAAERAHDLLGQRDDVVIVRAGGGVAGVRRALRAVASRRWAVVYLVDVGVSTSVASVVARASGSVVVLDTGDVAFELARSKGVVGPVRLAAIWAGERVALAAADEVVVRGRAHAELVPARKRVHHIPDIPPAEARPADADGIRGRLGIDGLFVVGLVGSINWAPRLGRTYGWDVIGALPHLSDRYCALIVGDGDGLARLERRAADLGVADRCRFVGRVAREEVYEYIAAMDVAVSTQTNDVVGAVRTTGKLPLYLACGRPVLASHVGEAASLLGPLGWTLPYDGTTDDAYPERLAGAVADWASDPEQQRRRAEQATILAHEAFDREEWAGRCDQVVDGVLARRRSGARDRGLPSFFTTRTRLSLRYGSPMLRSLGWRFAPAYMADRAARYQRSLRDRIGVTDAGREFIAAHGDSVLRGPFKGLRYLAEGDSAVGKLLGTYEQEIAGWVEEALAAKPKLFIDLGSADGYYVVGVKLREPGTEVHAFELSRVARKNLKRVAELNGVSIDAVHGKATARSVRRLVRPGAFVLCDIEGAEMDLFDPSLVEALRDDVVIVELHEGMRPGVIEALTERFSVTHHAEVVHSGPRDPSGYPELEALSDEARAAVGEMRSVEIAWGRFRPRSAEPSR